MSRRWLIALGFAALLGVAAVVGWTVAFRRHVVSEATSPDGTWGVAVLGRRLLDGQYELVAEVRDARGRPVPGGASVVGITTWENARSGYAVRFDGPGVARVGNVATREKSRYFAPPTER